MSAAHGLCGRCVHAREVVSGRGSRFVLCGRSRQDPRYLRYPQLPVLRCPGFEPPAPDAADRPGGSVARGPGGDQPELFG